MTTWIHDAAVTTDLADGEVCEGAACTEDGWAQEHASLQHEDGWAYNKQFSLI